MARWYCVHGENNDYEQKEQADNPDCIYWIDDAQGNCDCKRSKCPRVENPMSKDLANCMARVPNNLKSIFEWRCNEKEKSNI